MATGEQARLATYCSKIDTLDQLMALLDGDSHVKGLVSERHRKSVALIAAGQHFFSRFYSSASIRESILEKLWEEVDSPSVGDIGRWARSRIVAQAERVHMKLCHTEDMARSANYNGILMRVIRYRRKSRFKVFFRNLWRKVA